MRVQGIYCPNSANPYLHFVVTYRDTFRHYYEVNSPLVKPDSYTNKNRAIGKQPITTNFKAALPNSYSDFPYFYSFSYSYENIPYDMFSFVPVALTVLEFPTLDQTRVRGMSLRVKCKRGS